jgi:hypothetical protein
MRESKREDEKISDCRNRYIVMNVGSESQLFKRFYCGMF